MPTPLTYETLKRMQTAPFSLGQSLMAPRQMALDAAMQQQAMMAQMASQRMAMQQNALGMFLQLSTKRQDQQMELEERERDREHQFKLAQMQADLQRDLLKIKRGGRGGRGQASQLAYEVLAAKRQQTGDDPNRTLNELYKKMNDPFLPPKERKIYGEAHALATQIYKPVEYRTTAGLWGPSTIMATPARPGHAGRSVMTQQEPRPLTEEEQRRLEERRRLEVERLTERTWGIR